MFIAAENGALAGGKVGGVADVVQHLPPALDRCGWPTSVLTPAYGTFAALPGATSAGEVEVPFRGHWETVNVFEVPGTAANVRNIVFDHPLFAPRAAGEIYTERADEGPFETDASKFAFFGASTAAWIAGLPTPPDVVHLHDWHAAFYLLLRQYDPRFESLRDIRTVFTIHNLSYQGTRPLRGGDSSLEAWYPGLEYDAGLVGDPVATDCVNPLASAIRLADGLSTVSPTYAMEIRRPSDASTGFVGGEGLEADIDAAARDRRLVGILNGCDYRLGTGRRPGWPTLHTIIRKQLEDWLERDPGNAAHELALSRLDALPARRPQHLLVSIGRLVRQKSSLFLEALDDGRSALEHIAEDLGRNGLLIMLGSGEPGIEERILDVAGRCDRLLFLRGYSEALGDPLYRAGDLFLMPSSFEPCGISQMLAMSAGQPCIVHAVGGLRDTVADGRTGFTFEGATTTAQATGFVAAVDRALALRSTDRDAWQQVCQQARAARFDWADAARGTIGELYDA